MPVDHVNYHIVAVITTDHATIALERVYKIIA